MAFHPYPQVIRAVFNPHRFGPPLGVTPASPCSWVDRPGFGSTPRYSRALVAGLAFAPAPRDTRLASHLSSNSPDHNAKGTQSGRPKTTLLPLVGTRFQDLFHSPPGVLFTFPSRYSFTIGRQEYLALDGGPPSFPHERPSTWYSGGRSRRSLAFAYGALTHYGLPFQGSSTSDRLGNSAGTSPGPDDRLLQPPLRNGGNLSR